MIEIERDEKLHLLAALLNTQALAPEQSSIAESRLRATVTTGPELTQPEKRLLWLSPWVRADYLRIKKEVRAAIHARWRMLGISVELSGMAAAGDDEMITYHGAGGAYRLTLTREQEQDMPWAVTLQLGKTLRGTLAPLTTLRLLDSGGLEWTRARADRNGRISFGWYRTDVSPEQRLRRYPCRLEIV